MREEATDENRGSDPCRAHSAAAARAPVEVNLYVQVALNRPMRHEYTYAVPPVFDAHLLDLTRWMADDHACSWGEALAAVLPAALKREGGRRTVAVVSPEPPGPANPSSS